MPKYTFSKPYYNVAKSASSVTLEEAYNVYFEEIPSGGFAIRRRPGLTSDEGGITRGNGLYWSDRDQALYQAKSDAIYRKLAPNYSSVSIGSLSSNNLPAIFAEGQKLNTDNMIYVANGSHLVYIDSATGTVVSAPLAAPASTFVAMLGNMFIANDINNLQDFYISDFNADVSVMDPTFWASATNPWRAAAKSDILKGVFTQWNEILLLGTTACEVWQNDGVGPISPLVGSIIEAGSISPYSVAFANNSMFMLGVVSGKRSVICVSGHAPKVISEPIANILHSYSEVTDAIGTMCFVDGLNVYLLSLPTEQVTWAYDFKTDVWSQWSQWDLINARHKMFHGRYITYAKNWNIHYAQDGDGNLYTMSRSVYTDDSNPIRSSVRTGWIDHGVVGERKRSDQLVVKLQGYCHTDAKVVMRWRDDGRPEWSNDLVIDVQAGKQNDHYCRLNRMGIYRSRQYEFFMTDAADLALVGMEEDVTRMSS
jgi:hypothetical protein